MSGSSVAGSSVAGSSDQSKLKLWIYNIRGNSTVRQHIPIHEHFSNYGEIIYSEYVTVRPFTMAAGRSMLHYTRSYILILDGVTDFKKRELMEDSHIIDGLTVSVEIFEGSIDNFYVQHMAELDGEQYKYHLFLRSFTDMIEQHEVTRFLEDTFEGLQCRFHLLKDVYGVKPIPYRRSHNDPYRYDDFYEDDPDEEFSDTNDPPFQGDAIVSFHSLVDYDRAVNHVGSLSTNCICRVWDVKAETTLGAPLDDSIPVDLAHLKSLYRSC